MRAGQHPLHRANISQDPIPATEDVPGSIIFRVKLERSIHGLLDPG